MADTHRLMIEFRGGPFDGHLQDIGLFPYELGQYAMLPVNPELIASLTDGVEAARSEPTSVAIYELVRPGPVPRYDFLGAVDPEEADYLA